MEEERASAFNGQGNSQQRKYGFTQKSPYLEVKIKKHLARLFSCEPFKQREHEEFSNQTPMPVLSDNR